MRQDQYSKWNSVKVKAKYDYTCANCGSTENIQAHDPTKEHKDWREGIALCGYCHAKEHPNVPIGIFLSKNTQPYWYNVSARTIAKNIGCCSRTVIKIAKRLNITPYCEISDDDINRIKNQYVNGGNKPHSILCSDGITVMVCSECKSTIIKKAGIAITRKGRGQRYQCKNCARTFYEPNMKGEVK